MQDAFELSLTDAPSREAEAVIEDGLSAYNEAKAGYVDAWPLAVLVKNADGALVGGLVGRTTLGLLFVELIFLPEDARGQGLGARVMGMAEEEARRRGCTAATLYTIAFQAPAFYARHGYRELGRIECAPPGATRICMAKQL